MRTHECSADSSSGGPHAWEVEGASGPTGHELIGPPEASKPRFCHERTLNPNAYMSSPCMHFAEEVGLQDGTCWEVWPVVGHFDDQRKEYGC